MSLRAHFFFCARHPLLKNHLSRIPSGNSEVVLSSIHFGYAKKHAESIPRTSSKRVSSLKYHPVIPAKAGIPSKRLFTPLRVTRSGHSEEVCDRIISLYDSFRRDPSPFVNSGFRMTEVC